MEERRTGAGWFIFVLATALILLVAWLYTGWRSSQRVLPRGLSIGGIPMGSMTREQALAALAEAYAAPITVYYQDETIILVPEMVDLSLDVESTATNLDEALVTRSGIRGFFNYINVDVLKRETLEQEIQPILSYSRERLDAFLERTAQQYDHPPLDAVPLPEAGTFRAPQPGRSLDVEASRPLLVAALLSPVQEEFHLVVKTEPALPASMSILQTAIEGQLADFTGVAGIFAKDLNTGRELCYNCEVAFSGLSPLKVALVLARYQQIDGTPDTQTAEQIESLLTSGDTVATAPLLTQIGGGDPTVGAQNTTAFLGALGLENTFLAAPYELTEGAEPPGIVTEANARTDFDTAPDAYIQTTPLEAGLLFEALEYCAKGGGVLRLLYPQTITPAECEDTLNGLKRSQGAPMLTTELPEGTAIAYKHGWTGAAHAEVALIYSPQSTFLVSAYLYQPEWLVSDESAPTFAEIGNLAYRFFNTEAEPATTEESTP